MIVDTSAVFAVLLREPEAAVFRHALQMAPIRWMSAGTLVETSIVAARLDGVRGVTELDRFLAEACLEIIPVTADHARIARDGFLRYGKGRHAAALNYGDCFSYALAKATGQPLLCKGDDFQRTDIELVAVLQP
ncbi:MAG: type II toxin-antitoxin system VapC family toxin [Myxococcales bacterium]|nr:type II toxin-antitoxin system VapC family toxin [Myxococcales bacterium]